MELYEKNKVQSYLFSHQLVASCSLLQIITVKDSKRRLSLCSSEDSEPEEQEYQEVDDALPVLSSQSQLLDDGHLQRVSYTSYISLRGHHQFSTDII